MRTLCFGGSFNPIHHGHLVAARAAAESAGFDRILLVPSAQPPHKQAAVDLAAAADRLAMCERAVSGHSLFAVSDIELRRSGPSFTLSTARELLAQGLGQVYWLIGGDTVEQLPTWYQAEALLKEVGFVIMARPGWVIDWDKLSPLLTPLRSNVAHTPLIDISSTDIRQRVKAGKSIDFLTPPEVVEYIQAKGLYKA